MLVLCDLDGTLADISHRLHYLQGEKKDWDSFYEACDKDTVIGGTACMVDARIMNGDTVIYCSGRRMSVSGKTLSWLAKNRFWPSDDKGYVLLGGMPTELKLRSMPSPFAKYTCNGRWLLMRGDKDYRKDCIIKQEMLRWIQKYFGHPDMVYDDRRSVLGMWQMNGVRVHNCSHTRNNDF